VLSTIELMASKSYKAVPQDSFFANKDELKSAPKLFKETCRVNWNKPAIQVHNLIRGLSPYPGVWAILNDGHGDIIPVKLMRSTVVNRDSSNSEPGTIVTNGKSFMHVHCSLGLISIDEMQLPGKRNLPIKELLMGFRGIERYRFE